MSNKMIFFFKALKELPCRKGLLLPLREKRKRLKKKNLIEEETHLFMFDFKN